MNSIEKVRDYSSKAIKFINIVKVIIIIGIVITSILSITFIVGSFFADKINESILNGSAIGNISLKISNIEFLFVDFSESVELKELAESGNLEDVLITTAGEMITSLIKMIVSLILALTLKKLFVEINKGETPFNAEVLKRLKISFIIITILIGTESLLMAVIVGFSLACIYTMFTRSIELQEESDKTL